MRRSYALAALLTILRYRLTWLRNPRSGRALLKRFMDTTAHDAKANNNGNINGNVTDGKAPAPTQDGAQPAEQKPEPQKPEKPPRLILLIRHGQTTYNVEGRLPGQLPGVPLTDEGRRQAHTAAVALSAVPLSAVLTSPLERARDTAEILARGWGVAVREDPRLMDTDVRRWAGQKLEDVNKQDSAWKAFLDNPTEPPEGVESFTSVQARAVAVIEEALANPELGNYIAVVAHADVVKLILAHYTNVPLLTARFLWINNASLSALAFSENSPPHLLAMNWTASPGWLVPPLPKPVREPQAPAGADSQSQEGEAATPAAAPTSNASETERV
ncbi:MAG TPA: histidine phosphatase family protein [Ktedonobacterales bacterium]|nr:histidine phosphatase family protein [Ktedonobacterales bacterium]